LKYDVNVPSKSNNQKPLNENTYLLLASCQPLTRKTGSGAKSGSGSVSKCHESTTLIKAKVERETNPVSGVGKNP
jgi:hypothetical protein